MATRCSELDVANVGLTQEAEQSRTLDETLKKSQKDAQMDFLSSIYESIKRENPKLYALHLALMCQGWISSKLWWTGN